MEQILIITLRKHRTWGNILTPYLAESVQGKSFLSLKTFINYSELKKYSYVFSEKEKKLLKILDSYCDANLLKLFDKKSDSLQAFLHSVKQDKIDELIRPFIEDKIKAAMPILHELREEGLLNIYLKNDDLGTLHPNDKISLLPICSSAIFNFEKTDDGLKYFLSVKKKDEILRLNRRRGMVLVNEPCIAVIDNELVWFNDIDFKKLLPFFSKDFVQIPKTSVAVYFDKFIFNAIKKFDVNAKGFDIVEEQRDPQIKLSLVADIYNRILFDLSFSYGETEFKYGEKRKFEVFKRNQDGVFSFEKICRNKEFEAEVVKKLAKQDLIPISGSLFGMKDKDLKSHYNAVSWLNANSDFLDEHNVDVNPELSGKRYFTNDIKLNVALTEENDWFDVYGTIKFGDYEIPFVELRKYIVRGIKEFELPNKEVAVLPDEWFSEYQELMLMGVEKGGRLKLKKHHFNAISNKIQGIDNTHLGNLRKLTQSEMQEVPAPTGLKATLRSYQQVGFSWMTHLKALGFGGCLADDMGLGKTLQTLTMLLHAIKPRYEVAVEEEDVFDDGTGGVAIQLDIFGKPVETLQKTLTKNAPKKKDYSPATLIVMPVSLIHNWENEIRKFTPQLSVYKHVGANRTKSLTKLDSFDIVLTSYGIVRNDTAFFKKYNFYYLILDESQYIKNPDSKIYHAVNQLSAQNKLVLTGTPIENSLTDLWTQLNFLNKGMLGNLTFFKNEFITPIERNRDEDKQKKLQTLIQPFLLRRTKNQVAKDLPPLTEQVVYCNMTDEQRSFYEEEKSKVRNRIFESIEETGIEKSSMIVLQALTRLRQIANHPSMIQSDTEADSGKFDLVFDHIDNLIAENHKVLIYSSFVKHLELFENKFKERSLKYTKLTGETKDRKKAVDTFQDDEETQLFLISLKAGGVGLNLTAADYVFLLDPWWNPAAENQAINRAHRIGQDKNVFVYRFISKDSIEEKIVQLQEKKSALAELFINTNNPFKSLSLENIEMLFE